MMAAARRPSPARAGRGAKPPAGVSLACMDQPSAPRVQLMMRAQCHLCDQVRRVVQEVCAAEGEPWEEVDVDTDPERQKRYGELVPVVLVDGEQVGYWRIDPDRLRAALSGTGGAGARGLRARLRRRRRR